MNLNKDFFGFLGIVASVAITAFAIGQYFGTFQSPVSDFVPVAQATIVPSNSSECPWEIDVTKPNFGVAKLNGQTDPKTRKPVLQVLMENNLGLQGSDYTVYTNNSRTGVSASVVVQGRDRFQIQTYREAGDASNLGQSTESVEFLVFAKGSESIKHRIIGAVSWVEVVFCSIYAAITVLFFLLVIVSHKEST